MNLILGQQLMTRQDIGLLGSLLFYPAKVIDYYYKSQ